MHATRMIAAAARLTAVVAAAAALSACDVVVNSLESKGQAKDQWTKTFTIAATGDVEIVNANGRIDVTGVEGTQVEVVAERIAKAMTDEDAQKVLAQVEIVETVTEGGVRLETKAPKGEGRRVEVTYHVKVPASVSVRLQSANGTIAVAALDGIGESRDRQRDGGRPASSPAPSRRTRRTDRCGWTWAPWPPAASVPRR